MKKSAKKRVRQSAANRLRNRETKSTFRTAIKDFEAAVAANDKAAAENALKLSVKLLDTAAGKGIIHHNTADRKKSRITLKFNKMA